MRRTQFVLFMVAIVVVELFLYRHALSVQPSADDFILARQIRVGDTMGAGAFFTSSPLSDYRPLQSLTYWAIGRWNANNPFLLIHILNFVAFAFYSCVCALWIRLLRLPPAGTAAAAAVLVFHPLLTGPLVDLDGFGRFVVSSWVWLGAYFALRYANRLAFAIPLTTICLTVGLGFMEYAIALIPLGPAALWWSKQGRGRTAAATILLCVLVAVFAAYYVLRISIIGGDSGRLSADLILWAGNAALLGGATLFMGDTVSIYVAQDTAAITRLAVSILIMTILVAGGMWFWYERHRGIRARTTDTGSRAGTFLPIAFFLSFFPMVLMTHVSEIYATPIVFAFALLTGTAMAGWSLSRRYQRGAVAVFAVMLLWASSSVMRKVAYLSDTGGRASVQIASLLDAVPEAAHDARVALIFLESDLPPRRTYSVFRGGDDHLIQPGESAQAMMEWFRPGKNIQLVHSVVPDEGHVPQDFDLLLRWEAQARRFQPLPAAIAPDAAVDPY